MSANNQTLVRKYKGKWYVFLNIMAESWNKTNNLSIKEADFSGTQEEAQRYAFQNSITEYGIADHLIKDGNKVKLTQ
jgi:hypothetical protein